MFFCGFFQYFEALADLIKQGIEIANEDLKKESQEKLQQEVCLPVPRFSIILPSQNKHYFIEKDGK